MKKRPLILVNPENCRGCRSCEVACAWRNKGAFNPRLSGIHIMKLDNAGMDYPVLSSECLEWFCGKQAPQASRAYEPACVTACQFQALRLNPEVEDE